MPIIKLTPELIREGAQKLVKAKADNDGAIAKLDGIVNGLVSIWHGEAQDAFANSYANKRKTFESFSLDIENLVTALNRYANVMESEEKAKAGSAAHLS